MHALLAIDGSHESTLALETAAGLSWPAGSRLDILTVLPLEADWYGGPWAAGVAYVPSEDVRARLRADRDALLEIAAARLRRPGLDVRTRLGEGRAASVIVDSARETGAELVIVGARGHGAIESALIGSVSAEVVDQAPCAVFVARRPTTARILIGTDGSDAATSAADFVARCGLFEGSRARMIHAIDVHPAWWLGYTPGDATFAVDAYSAVVEEGHRRGEQVTAMLADRLGGAGLGVSTVTREGPAAAAIVDEATSWGADLVVVGTRGLGLLQRLLLGSTARSVLHHAPASVLITRPSAAGRATEDRTTQRTADPLPA
jgi:nucleotide-binding universal stress UspA family protein